MNAYDACSYSIRATTSEGMTLLQDGIPVREALQQGQVDYFQFPVGARQDDLAIIVTDLGTGDPDLFVGLTPRPNATTAIWASRSISSDSVIITLDDPAACA